MIFYLPYAPAPRGVPAFVLGADVAAAWRVLIPGNSYPSDVLGTVPRTVAAVPGCWFLDLAELMRGRVRAKRLLPADARGFLTSLQAFAIWVDDETPFRAWAETFELACRHRIDTSRAAYLERALRMKVPLATTDAPLVRAAGAAGVPIFAP